MPGLAKDIGVSTNGDVWIIGTNKVGGGWGIYKWTENTWKNMTGGAIAISVDDQGNPWVVNESANIFRYNGNGWEKMPGAAHDIGCGGG
jgi:hypothetical protein